MASGKGFVVLRLFNFLGREVGPSLLKQGVGVSGDDLQGVLGEKNGPLRGEVEELVVNGEKRNGEGLKAEVLSGKHVFLQVREA
jgi:hypothetical protein